MDPIDAADFTNPCGCFSSRGRKAAKGKVKRNEWAALPNRDRKQNRNKRNITLWREDRRTSQKKKSSLKASRAGGGRVGDLNCRYTYKSRCWYWSSCYNTDDAWYDQCDYYGYWCGYGDAVASDVECMVGEERYDELADQQAKADLCEESWNNGDRFYRWARTDGGGYAGPPEECRYAVAVCNALAMSGRAVPNDPLSVGIVGLPDDLRRRITKLAFGLWPPFAPGIYLHARQWDGCVDTLTILPDMTARLDSFWVDEDLDDFLYNWDSQDIAAFTKRDSFYADLRCEGTTATFASASSWGLGCRYEDSVCTAKRAPSETLQDLEYDWVIDVRCIRTGPGGWVRVSEASRFHMERAL